uniref:Uncharacterized protein n=1 Tax=Utricularia reniformis TaxID=192314 RepID=A0A1Y0B2W7_9LAMI|nr:hypothetical protein AEK19_MT1557 [Utricularia reniformis]ART31744.1 hypothetical protein AEK19_MT1557 [Utricularia reniformis]
MIYIPLQHGKKRKAKRAKRRSTSHPSKEALSRVLHMNLHGSTWMVGVSKT